MIEDFKLRYSPYTKEQLARLKTWSTQSEFELFLNWLKLFSQEQKITNWDSVSDEMLVDTKKRIQVLDSLIKQISLFPNYVTTKVAPQKYVKAVGNTLQAGKK